MVQNLYAKVKGGPKRDELNSKVTRFHIFEGQTASVTCLREENEAIRDELEEWKQNYQDLKSESKQLFEEMYAAIQEKEQSFSDLQLKNEELLSYIEKIENSDKTYAGKDISEVKMNSCTLKAFLSKTVLWFAKSFGLELESMTINEPRLASVIQKWLKTRSQIKMGTQMYLTWCQVVSPQVTSPQLKLCHRSFTNQLM